MCVSVTAELYTICGWCYGICYCLHHSLIMCAPAMCHTPLGICEYSDQFTCLVFAVYCGYGHKSDMV